MGIPARYCEGFVIKGSDIAMFPSEGRYTTVSVPDSRAHAWVEIYADGFGWIVSRLLPATEIWCSAKMQRIMPTPRKSPR